MSVLGKIACLYKIYFADTYQNKVIHGKRCATQNLYILLEVYFLYDPVCLSLGGSVGLLDGWLVSRSVCHNFLKESGKLHFHAPI